VWITLIKLLMSFVEEGDRGEIFNALDNDEPGCN
jgi:hypothetical protein